MRNPSGSATRPESEVATGVAFPQRSSEGWRLSLSLASSSPGRAIRGASTPPARRAQRQSVPCRVEAAGRGQASPSRLLAHPDAEIDHRALTAAGDNYDPAQGEHRRLTCTNEIADRLMGLIRNPGRGQCKRCTHRTLLVSGGSGGQNVCARRTINAEPVWRTRRGYDQPNSSSHRRAA